MNKEIVRCAVVGFLVEVTNGSLHRADHINSHPPSTGSCHGPAGYGYWQDVHSESLRAFLSSIGVDPDKLLAWSRQKMREGSRLCAVLGGGERFPGFIQPPEYLTISGMATNILTFMEEEGRFVETPDTM